MGNDAEKQCTVCREVMGLTSFGPSKAGRMGLQSACRPCRATAQRLHRKKTGRASDRKYERSGKGRVVRSRYEQTGGGRAAVTRKSQKYAASEKGASKIREYQKGRPWYGQCMSAVTVAVAKGNIPRPDAVPCSGASADCAGRHEYHHDSYAKADWLRVTCYCKFHHVAWHGTNTPQAFEAA